VTTTRGQTTDDTAERSFASFYAEHYQRVYAYCRRRVGPQAAEDAAAEVFAAAWRKWSALPEGREALPWLYAAAYREILHHWRSAARSRRLMDRVTGTGRLPLPGPDHLVARTVEVETARRALERLRPADREVLRLAVWEELSIAEIAVVLALTGDAATMRFVRAKRRFGREYRSVEAADDRAVRRRRAATEGAGR
jgi:RNA polymerase sigma-70 factor (ECF subfamily)